MCDFVAFPHRQVSIYYDMQVDVVAETHLSYKALVQPNHSGHMSSDLPDSCLQSWIGSDVTEFKNRWPKLPPCVVQDDERGTESGPAICGCPTFPSDKGNRHSGKGKSRCDGVTSVVPSITLDCDAADGVADCGTIVAAKYSASESLYKVDDCSRVPTDISAVGLKAPETIIPSVAN